MDVVERQESCESCLYTSSELRMTHHVCLLLLGSILPATSQVAILRGLGQSAPYPGWIGARDA